MNFRPLFITILVLTASIARGAVVVDSISAEPLAMASVFDRNGNIIGTTDSRGYLPRFESSSYPLTVRYMGYESAQVERGDADTVRMKEQTYVLPELAVASGKRNILYMTGYIREYSTLTTYNDTVVMFREKTVDFMVPDKEEKRIKGWSNQRILSSRSYYHISNYWGLDSVSDRFNRNFSWGDWVGIVNRVKIPAKLRDAEVAVDTLWGKYSPATIWRRDGDRLTLDINVLADTVNRRWVSNFWGFNNNRAEFSTLTLRYTFDNISSTELLADNLSSISFNIESRGRGPNLYNVFEKDEPFFVSTYVEMYITDRRFLTLKEARNIEKHLAEAIDGQILRPDQVPPLQPAIAALVERVDSIDHDRRHREIATDKRIGAFRDGRPARPLSIGTIVDAVKGKVKRWRGR
ncbi:MAG: hypothetical protein J1E63_04370 [Muribaculaceae bacterium]|nr:hypothetical protein [Muribaculaceae bacterium]